MPRTAAQSWLGGGLGHELVVPAVVDNHLAVDPRVTCQDDVVLGREMSDEVLVDADLDTARAIRDGALPARVRLEGRRGRVPARSLRTVVEGGEGDWPSLSSARARAGERGAHALGGVIRPT